jgi:cytochrome P450
MQARAPLTTRLATGGDLSSFLSQLDRVVYGLISRRRAELSAAGEAAAAFAAGAPLAADLLSSLLTARDEDGSAMGDVALRDELMTLLVAGQVGCGAGLQDYP